MTGRPAEVPAAATELSSGAVLAGAGDGPVFLVVDPGTATAMPSCSGVPLHRSRPLPCSLPDAPSTGRGMVRAGSRLADPPTGLRLLCIRSGPGALTYTGRPMVRESAVPGGWRRPEG
jgi:hypothetical protein